MPELMLAPPHSDIEPVTEILHGMSVTDPYRWLEDQDSPRTRKWIEDQRRFARAYLDRLPGRDLIRARIREFLEVDTYDSLQKSANRYFFRKRLANEEQPRIYLREGAYGEDQLLVDPAEHGAGNYISVKPLRVSFDGRLLLFEVKEGGERTGTFKLLDIESRRTLPDVLPRGYLRGFAFAPDGKSFCYVHEPANEKQPYRHAAFRHVLGSEFSEDREIFFGGEGDKVRLCLTSDRTRIGFLVYRFLEKTLTDFYLQPWDSETAPAHIIRDAEYRFGPVFFRDRILSITDHNSPNLRVIELRFHPGTEPEWKDVIPVSDSRILQWVLAGERIVILYGKNMDRQIRVFELSEGKEGRGGAGAGLSARQTDEVAINPDETFRISSAGPASDEVILERESFTEPVRIVRCSPANKECSLWAEKTIPACASDIVQTQIPIHRKTGPGFRCTSWAARKSLRGAAIPPS